jgi:hypothetical protein
MPAAETTEAILLRRARFGESSYVLIWLSPEHGKIRTAARGTARKDSKLRGRLDLFYHAEVQFAAGRKSDLHALRELTRVLEIPVVGTEVLAKHPYSVAECISTRVVDRVRADVSWTGGVSGVMKTARLAEAFGVNCEVHTAIFHPLEMVNLHWADVDMAAGTVRVSAKRSGEFLLRDEALPILAWSAKTYEERTVPLPESTIRLLGDLRRPTRLHLRRRAERLLHHLRRRPRRRRRGLRRRTRLRGSRRARARGRPRAPRRGWGPARTPRCRSRSPRSAPPRRPARRGLRSARRSRRGSTRPSS